jgi:outer membrane protein OmpA-like peptidoglycan-associated protein
MNGFPIPVSSKSRRMFVALAAAAALLGASAASAQAANAPRRTTLAITYGESASTHVDMIGSASLPGTVGEARIERKQGRTTVRLQMKELPHPQTLGAFYTTYIVWAVAPEGQAENLVELPYDKDVEVGVTTSFPTFGLLVTAEPHSAVRLPSPMVVAENAAREDTKGILRTGRIEYGGAVGALYAATPSRDAARRLDLPLVVLGARNAVEIAREAGADRYAATEFREAGMKLAALEHTLPRGGKQAKANESLARDVMRLAEHARAVAAERSEQARNESERRAASESIAQAQSEADLARTETELERARADDERARADAARIRAEQERADADRAKLDEELARRRADQALTNEELARRSAEEARLGEERALREADAARRDKAEMQQQLFQSLSAILETRREARGLIVSLSDVLFDFGRASLTPGAREKLSRLAGVLTAYPGSFRLQFEGHTDSVGSFEYNQRLSQDRAESVRLYLMGAGIPRDRVADAVGFGESRPVASNDAAAGRQMNRRVEIVVAELD